MNIRKQLLALLLHILILGDPEVNSESAANEYDSSYNVADPLVVSVPPLLECGRDLSLSSTDVTLSILVVIVLVAGGSGGLTNVTILVAIVVVSMGDASGLLTYVTAGITVVVVLMSDLSGRGANVTLGIASVIVLVGRSSGSAANVTLAVAVVVEGVLLAGGNGLAALGLGSFGGLATLGSLIAGLSGLLSENGYCGHAEQYGENCKKSRKKGKILLHG